MTDNELIEKMQVLEVDHTPDGYPAVTMGEISRLTELALKTLAIRVICATKHESKEAFIARVGRILEGN
jgi:hypothetical protein